MPQNSLSDTDIHQNGGKQVVLAILRKVFHLFGLHVAEAICTRPRLDEIQECREAI